MSSSQTELVELSDPSAESNIKDTLVQTRPKKKVKLAKRYCVIHSERLKEEGMSWLSKVDDFTANCTLCRQSFSVKYNGKFAVSCHAKSQKHKRNIILQIETTTLTAFF